MSVLIKGMDMPHLGIGQRPYEDIRVWHDGTVETLLGAWNRPSDYRAIPVPPHGRLIDADALIDAIIAKYIRHERKKELVFAAVEIKQDMADIINELPTIIEAEEGE